VWQWPVISNHEEFEVLPPNPSGYRPLPRVKLRPGASIDTVSFAGGLGYARAAERSWQLFQRLQREAQLPPGWRFQVCLPTPLAPIWVFVEPELQAALESRYEAAMMREVDSIMAVIPHDRLALQWDTAVEFGILDGPARAWFSNAEQGIVERLLRIGRRVPERVELGYHLCYGDAPQGGGKHGHFLEPADLSTVVRIGTALADGLPRLNWLHMPVPVARDDDGYFEPLQHLRLRPETELYLGLVHDQDGVDGGRRRLSAASRHTPAQFGIATECGFGRRRPDTITALLELHAQLSQPRR
jgi:hypothetical protein